MINEKREMIIMKFKNLLFIVLLCGSLCGSISLASADPTAYYIESGPAFQFYGGAMPGMDYLVNNTYSVATFSRANPVYSSEHAGTLVNSDGSFTFVNITKASSPSHYDVIFENTTIDFTGSNHANFLPTPWKLSNSMIDGGGSGVQFEVEWLGSYDLKNTVFKNITGYVQNHQADWEPYYGNISNVSVYNSQNGLLIKRKINGTVSNLHFENMTRQSFLGSYFENVLIDNVVIKNGGDYTNPATYVGFLIGAGHDNTVRNISIDGSPWSAITYSAYPYNITLENVDIKNAGHNGVDLHPAWNCSINNLVVRSSVAENVLLAGNAEQYMPDYDLVDWTLSNDARIMHSIKITNYSSYDSPGSSLSANRLIHLDVENMVSQNTSGISINYAMDVSIINATTENTVNTYSMTLGTGSTDYRSRVEDAYIIDSSFDKKVWLYMVNNSRFLNIDTRGYDFYPKFYGEYLNAYYLDLLVLDENGSPVSNSDVSIITNSEKLPSINGFAKDQSSFSTSSNGHTILPNENRGESPALIEYYDNSISESTTVNSELDITSSAGNVVLEDITPDSTWYRENPNIPTYTITAIIPDESSTEPQITGFAPSSDNPFTAGESKKFQVWADEELTTMKWYVNGNLVSSGSMDYTWKVESGSTTIMFSGFNSNGAVVQTWEITEGEIVEEAPVSSGTGLSFTPSASSLTATTGESTTFSVETTQEFTSAVWSVDGTEVETGTTGHVEAWTTAGTHTVTFDGTAAAGTISRSWTVVVSAAAESEYSSISISPSTTTVAPGESFSLDVYIDPTQALTGSQFDLQYSQLASISTVDEGDLFTTGDLATTFQYDSIDNAAGLLDNVYAAIVGSGTITSPDVMATIEMVAGSSSGILNIGLSDVILSDVNSNPAGYTVSNATVLIDTAPQFTSVPSQTVVEGQSLSFTVSATDADADELTYTATTLPSGATFNGGSFSWTPSEGDAGSYVASFEVTDGYLTDTVNVSITVTPLNHMPEITLFEPADSSVFEEGSTIEVNVAANDADGDSLSYLIEIDGVQVSTSSSYSWTTDYESAGTHTIKVTISDGTEEVSSSSTITITDLQPRWDVNEDGIVNVLDITLVGQNYGMAYTTDLPRWDVNQDGTVNIQDLSIVSGHFGETV
jgi:hypothetical protein